MHPRGSPKSGERPGLDAYGADASVLPDDGAAEGEVWAGDTVPVGDVGSTAVDTLRRMRARADLPALAFGALGACTALLGWFRPESPLVWLLAGGLAGAALGVRSMLARGVEEDVTDVDLGVDGIDDVESLELSLPATGRTRALSGRAELATFVDALTNQGEAWAVLVLHPLGGTTERALPLLAEATADAPLDVVVHAPIGRDALGLLARPGDLGVLAPAFLRHFEAVLGASGAVVRLRVGVAIAPHDGSGADVVDRAVAASRGEQAGVVYHDRRALDALRERAALKRELRRALADAEIVAHYQPIVDPRTFELVGAEALVRWAHPEHGLLAPARFLPLVEDQGAMLDLTGRILGKACRRVLEWRPTVHPAFTVVVNASGAQLKDQWLARLVQHVVDRSGVPAESLCFEIELADLRGRDARLLRTLERLAWIGVRQVIDGVATPEELRLLADLPVEAVKLDARRLGVAGDGFLARRAHEVGEAAAARGLALHVKRVETVGQLEALRGVPTVTRVQGFALAPPMQRTGLAALAASPRPFAGVIADTSAGTSPGSGWSLRTDRT
jgi:EAL domain-containing protein (putative c-di-GMP-specific phosphodiesterase class I)